MTRCELCETIEGDWIYKEIDGDEVPVCQECGGEDCQLLIPEHDDYDMDR